MSARKSREPRQRVHVVARMLAGTRWTDVTIQNVSRRGLMAYCQEPPRRGDYVELHKADQVIVARVAWSAGGSFGMRAQDDIDIAALVGKQRPGPYRGPERRKRPRDKPVPACADPPDRAWQRSRRIASLIDFSVVALAGLGAAILLFTWVQDTLGEPVADARRAFAGAAASRAAEP